MRRIVSAVCCFIFLLVALSCEEKMHSIDAEDGSSLLSRAARRSIESDFADFDFSKFNIKPQWELAIKHQGNVMEVPFKYKDKSIKPRLKDYPGAKETSARLILSKKGNEVVAEVIYYFPSTDFKGEISEINLRNYKAMKFDGIFMFQQLGEDDIHLRFVEKGDIIKKRLGTKVSQAKNGRTMACQEWGVFWDHYENGVLVSWELLYTYNVCDGGGSIDQDQAPPEPGGGNPEPVAGAVNAQLLVDVQGFFDWLTGVPQLANLFSNLNACNVYAILSSPLGPPGQQSSYTVGSSVAGACYYGGWTPTNNQILEIIPACTGCTTYYVQTQQAGNVNINIQAGVTAAGVGGGLNMQMNQAHGGIFGWYRQ